MNWRLDVDRGPGLKVTDLKKEDIRKLVKRIFSISILSKKPGDKNLSMLVNYVVRCLGIKWIKRRLTNGFN
ncbi:hypothetical protein [Membranihabitans maritimus]|uniref:hypothetical protein n=1 Tax=Membranihabitans maritimus TaxID=2904244 RepID=UPI001F2D93F5|nr:hypothetical protein [Membranihabitans maritimus]